MRMERITQESKDKNTVLEMDLIRNRLIDNSLIAFSFLALFSTLFTVFRTYYTGGFNWVFFLQTSLAFFFISMTLFRKRVSINFKVLFLFLAIFMIQISGIYQYGFLASSKIYTLLIPIYAVFIFSNRTAVFFLSISIFYLIIMAYLHTSGILQVTFDANIYIRKMFSWAVDYVALSIAVVAIYIISKTYRDSMLHNISIQNDKNIELELYKKHLEDLVQQRTEELNLNHQKVLQQKEELEETLQQLQETQNKLIESEKMASLGILTSGLAHEMNNPLNFIKAGIYSLENITKEITGSEEFKDLQNKILENMNTGVEVTDIVKGLNFFNVHTETRKDECEVNQMINHSLIILQHEIIKRKITLHKHYYPENIEIFISESKLHQVIFNVLLNSIQAIQGDGGKITIHTELNNKMIKIRIIDNGIGIKEEGLKRIFDPFFTTKPTGLGKGLGLSIVYGILKEYNGTIQYSSIPGQGTEAIIELPSNKIEN